MKKRIKAAIHHLFGNKLLKIIEADNSFSYDGIDLVIPPGIFHPKYFTSSKLLLQFVEAKNLVNKSVLELGCGSGIVSFVASKKGADVTATDISKNVITNMLANQNKNGIVFTAFCSDLFDEIPNTNFDYILINPPFYPKNPSEEKEHAWYCGAEFNYFIKLFNQLSISNVEKGVFMTLSNDCDLIQIMKIADQKNYRFAKIKTAKNVSEINYLFEIIRT